VDRFLPVDASSYDDIRMMVDACEAAGFLLGLTGPALAARWPVEPMHSRHHLI